MCIRDRQSSVQLKYGHARQVLRKLVDAFRSYRETYPKQIDRQMLNGRVKIEHSLRSLNHTISGGIFTQQNLYIFSMELHVFTFLCAYFLVHTEKVETH